MVPIDALDNSQRIEAARLVIASLPEYYAAFGAPHHALEQAVAEQFAQAGSELCEARAMLNGTVTGLYCALATRRLRTAQLIGLKHLMQALSPTDAEARARISDFATSVAPLPSQGWYLSRIAVHEESRGTGVADRILADFLDRAPSRQPVLLHVHRDNKRAINFYTRHNFEFVVPSEYTYYAMIRAADA